MPVLVIDKIQQKNDGDFFLMDAKDIETSDGKSLEEKLVEIQENVSGDSGEVDEFVAIFESALATE